jgi:hypothetical protein
MILRALILTFCLACAITTKAVTIETPPAPVVTNTNDSGAGSLREALVAAKEGDRIRFEIPTSDPGYRAGVWTISLTSGELPIKNDITLSGPGPSRLVLQRNQNATSFSIFPVKPRHTITIEGLTMADDLPPGSQMALFTGASAIAAAGCVWLFWRHLARRNERRIRFGLLWNGKRQPLCAKCGHALHVLNDFSFHCRRCEVELGAYGDNGRTISPREALDRIRLKEYWSGS